MKINTIVGIIIMITAGLVSAAPAGWRNETCVYYPTVYKLSHLCLSVGDPATIHILAQADGNDRCVDVVYYRSTNTGVTWFGGVNFEFGVSPVPYRSTDIISQGNEVLVCYQQSMDTPNYINFFRSTNSGNTWTPCIPIQTSAQHPRLAMDGNYVHAFYSYKPDASGYEVYLKQSTDHGATWPTDQRLTVADRNSWHPAVSVNANAIHLVWADNRGDDPQNYEIYYDKSTDHGQTWVYSTTSGLLMYSINGVSEYPDIVAFSDPNYQSVHVVWMDNRQDAPGVYYLRSTDNGVNWPSNPILLLDGGRHPAIAADSRGLYIVCVKNSDIWYLESTNWGTSWNTPLNVTPSVDYADSLPDIHADAMGRHTIFLRDGSLFYIQRDIIVPSAPMNLHKDPFCVPPPVVLLWNANSEPDLYDYRVYRRQLPSGKWAMIGTAKNATYTDNTVSGGYWYEYYVTARDLALNESSSSNSLQVYIPEPKKIVDLGLPEPSIYTLERTGYYHWGGTPDSTADYGDVLRYRLTGFMPENDYSLGFVLFEPATDSGRVIGLRSASYSLDSIIAVPESALCLSYRLPAAVYGQGHVALTLTGRNRYAVLSQILVWETAHGGTQSVGSINPGANNNIEIYPNPSIGKTEIKFTIEKQSETNLKIYDATGQLVVSNDLGLMDAGQHRVVFDDKTVNSLPGGVYFIEMNAGNVKMSERFVYWK